MLSKKAAVAIVVLPSRRAGSRWRRRTGTRCRCRAVSRSAEFRGYEKWQMIAVSHNGARSQ